MNYYEYLASILLSYIPDDASDLLAGTMIPIFTFPDGTVYQLEYKGYAGIMANPASDLRPKSGYFDFVIHTADRYQSLYRYRIVTHYNLFRDL